MHLVAKWPLERSVHFAVSVQTPSVTDALTAGLAARANK